MHADLEYPYIVVALALTYPGVLIEDADDEDIRCMIVELGLN